ncbi:MAG: hypothetical protein Rhims3KO_03930 [Hyphomicrobiales bacterium]
MKIATSPMEPVAVITSVCRMVEPVTKRGVVSSSALEEGPVLEDREVAMTGQVNLKSPPVKQALMRAAS